MEIDLTEDQQAFIREAVETGRLRSAEDAVREAMLLWEERERRRLEILNAVDRSEASLSRGEGRSITSRDTAVQLAEDVKQRGLARFRGERNTQ